jgi:hypothetical protein
MSTDVDLDIGDLIASLQEALASDAYRAVELTAQAHYADQVREASAKVKAYGTSAPLYGPRRLGPISV